jgi:hypothetical protein
MNTPNPFNLTRKRLPYKVASYVFPNDLLTSDKHGGNFMLFHINEQISIPNVSERAKKVRDKDGNFVSRTPTANNTKAKTAKLNRTTVTTDSIALYIPNGIKMVSSMGYEHTAELGFIVSAIAKSIQGNDNLGDIASSITDRVKNAYFTQEQLYRSGIHALPGIFSAIGSLTGNAGIRSGALNTSNAIGGQTDALINAYNLSRGEAFNPFKEVLFKGVEFREFSFTFQMYPRSKDESDSINEIVELFRYHMHPEENTAQEGRFFIYPSDFDIEFYTLFDNEESNDVVDPEFGLLAMDSAKSIKENKYLMSLSTCVLTSMDVNYTPSNVFVTHNDGSPMGVEMTLRFRETEIMTKRRIQELNDSKFKQVETGSKGVR